MGYYFTQLYSLPSFEKLNGLYEVFRVTDREFRKRVKRINRYLKKIDPSISPLPEKVTGEMPMASTFISYVNVRTQVAVVKPKGQEGSDLIFSASVCKLPKENLLPFYRQLLIWNVFQTGVAHFGISDEEDVVLLVMRRPIAGLSFSEFIHAVERISSVTLNTLRMLEQ